MSNLILQLKEHFQNLSPDTFLPTTKFNMRSMSSPTSAKGIAAIVGVGPNLGRSIAHKFAHEGYTVAILSRDLAKLSQLADEIAREAKARVFAIRIDCSDQKSVREAFESVLSLGFIEVLVYNACHHSPSGSNAARFADITVGSFERSISVSAVGAFQCAKQIIPVMAERGRGTVIFTGSSASVTGFAGCCELSCGKFALRALSQCLAREFQVSGIHVAHVVIDGTIGTPGSSSTGDQSMDSTIDPDALAQAYWQLHIQEKGAWSQEIDLRSSTQRF